LSPVRGDRRTAAKEPAAGWPAIHANGRKGAEEVGQKIAGAQAGASLNTGTPWPCNVNATIGGHPLIPRVRCPAKGLSIKKYLFMDIFSRDRNT
jgi:hypothetical protein